MKTQSKKEFSALIERAEELGDAFQAFFLIEDARYELTSDTAKKRPTLDSLQTIFSLTAAFGHSRIGRQENVRQFQEAIWSLRSHLWFRGLFMSKEQRLRYAAAIVDLREELYIHASNAKKAFLPKSIAVSSKRRIKSLEPYSLNRLRPGV